ncbi:claudin-4-like [Petromyzon marinus]|uniref:Claudin n=1 Tax=Petromyzon marinus TaxID=7757 RepID=A0AAJ7UJR1_PETMA|nr:claudin-3-like [Petromyzon marinus]
MVNAGLQMVGLALSLLGTVGGIVSCALPMWKVSALLGSSVITSIMTYEGLWMNCVVQSTGQMQCKRYDSMLALGQDLQAARALTVIAVVLAGVGILVAIAGAKCTTCVEDEATKARVSIAAGAVFVLAGALEIVPASWSANAIVRDFHNPLVPEAGKRDMGASLYLGWASSALMLLGGALLCCSCPPKKPKYAPPKSSMGGGGPRSNFV